MNKLSAVNDATLLRKLKEIDTKLTCFLLSVGESDSLCMERYKIKKELEKRGHTIDN